MKKMLSLLLALTLFACVTADFIGHNTATALEPASDAYASTIEWAAEYDVIIAGYGAAGANAAIVAADLGAKVLITEKAPQGREGGGSKYAGQVVMATDNADELFYYIQGMRGLFGHTLSDDMIRTFADGAALNRQWLLDLGAKPDTMENFRNGTGIWNEYPELRGGEHCEALLVNGTTFDGSYFYLLQDNVNKRRDNIDVWYEAPAVHLIQEPDTKVILGVQIEKDGVVYNVRAKNGVILATGGFEANMEMMANFLQQPYALVYAASYNTGDGIVMAQEVGAKLWHMSNSAGYIWGFLPPGAETCLSFGSAVRRGGILVGTNGERFMNEAQENRHGRIDVGGRWISMPMPLPTWLILDEADISAGKLHNSFSEGNVDEIEKGWIMKADTIEQLAELCAIPPEKLLETVAAWNESCAAGEDGLYGRPADGMKPLNGPFYALPLGPTMYNTQGGPQRNSNAEVLNLAGNPIPHLYSAGEMGAMWPDMYNGGGNLAEATIFGRIAGTNAASVKDDTVPESLLNGKTPVNFNAATTETADVSENEYTGSATGMGGPLTVKVTMDGTKIVAIDILNQNETVGIGDKAVAAIPAAILEAQSIEVDTIAGATISSKAILEAVKQALDKVA